MTRIWTLCFAILAWARCATAQDDDPFRSVPTSPGSTAAVIPSALEDAATLIAAEPALVNAQHEQIYKAYLAAVATVDATHDARAKALGAESVAALEKAKPGLDPAGTRSAASAIDGISKGNITALAPGASDPAKLATVKRARLGHHQRLRASRGLAHANAIRDYVGALEKLQGALAAEAKIGDAAFITGEIRGLRGLLERGGTGGVPLEAFHFRHIPATGARTELPALFCGIPIVTALGGDFSGAQTSLILRPPTKGLAGSGTPWDLRGGFVPVEASGGVTLMEAPLIDFPGAKVTVREWQGGATAPPLKLLPAAEGFCVICGLRGPFETGTEARVFIDPADKTWTLTGKGGQADTTIAVAVVRFPDPATRPSLVTRPFAWINGAPHVRMVDSANAFCGFTRLAGPLEARNSALRLAIGADGFWYLQGRGTAPTTAAEATAFTLAPAS